MVLPRSSKSSPFEIPQDYNHMAMIIPWSVVTTTSTKVGIFYPSAYVRNFPYYIAYSWYIFILLLGFNTPELLPNEIYVFFTVYVNLMLTYFKPLPYV